MTGVWWYLTVILTCTSQMTSDVEQEKAMATYSSTLAWKIPWMEEPGRLQSMGSVRVRHDRDFTFTFHFHALEKEMATHSSVLAWRIPGTGEPGGLPSMGSHRVRHDWNDLAAAAAANIIRASGRVWNVTVGHKVNLLEREKSDITIGMGVHVHDLKIHIF